jgi:hypothetical protein
VRGGGKGDDPQYMYTRLADALQVRREYFGPEAEQWMDYELLHQLVCRVLDLNRQLSELRPKEPAWEAPKRQYGGTRDADAR